jgi:hypothetical protein
MVLVQQLIQCPALSGEGFKFALVRGGVKQAGNAIEFSQIDRLNFHTKPPIVDCESRVTSSKISEASFLSLTACIDSLYGFS